jgi:hypothetical protein
MGDRHQQRRDSFDGTSLPHFQLGLLQRHHGIIPSCGRVWSRTLPGGLDPAPAARLPRAWGRSRPHDSQVGGVAAAPPLIR